MPEMNLIGYLKIGSFLSAIVKFMLIKTKHQKCSAHPILKNALIIFEYNYSVFRR